MFRPFLISALGLALDPDAAAGVLLDLVSSSFVDPHAAMTSAAAMTSTTARSRRDMCLCDMNSLQLWHWLRGCTARWVVGTRLAHPRRKAWSEYREEQEAPRHDRQDVVGDVVERQRVADRAEQKHRADDAEDVAAAAEDRDAAEQHDRDH